jgi:hypothetical protein
MVREVSNRDLPLSSFIKGSKERPEKTVGMPMTTPENVDVPPRCWAYSFDDDTMIKKDICAIRR